MGPQRRAIHAHPRAEDPTDAGEEAAWPVRAAEQDLRYQVNRSNDGKQRQRAGYACNGSRVGPPLNDRGRG
jgi:hypothetical protein